MIVALMARDILSFIRTGISSENIIHFMYDIQADLLLIMIVTEKDGFE